jgi:hypothetical protein
MHSYIHFWTILAANNDWQQTVAGSKQWLVIKNGWQQTMTDNKHRLVINTG